jgi:protein TonB
VISVALPPLDCSETPPSLGERAIRVGIVLALHLLLVYAALYLSVKNDLIRLPPSISVRLLPMIEEAKIEPAKPLPPPPKPQPQLRRPPPLQPQPVLAVASEAPSSSFVVPPQPPAPPPQPIVAPPAPPAPLVAARFDADYLHNPKPAYPPAARRNGEEGKVLLKVRVSSQGTALDVAISKSSGFGRLDNAAAEAVARWRFVPAKRGDEAVESSVIVPITFALE